MFFFLIKVWRDFDPGARNRSRSSAIWFNLWDFNSVWNGAKRIGATICTPHARRPGENPIWFQLRERFIKLSKFCFCRKISFYHKKKIRRKKIKIKKSEEENPKKKSFFTFSVTHLWEIWEAAFATHDCTFNSVSFLRRTFCDSFGDEGRRWELNRRQGERFSLFALSNRVKIIQLEQKSFLIFRILRWRWCC